MTDTDHGHIALQRLRSQQMGWLGLALWASFGVLLELAHGFKWSTYLDDELLSMLLRLAHAHGVGLSLVLLAHAAVGAELFENAPARGARVGRALRLGAALIPLGFALSAPFHSESDPALPIVLVPLGAALLLYALVNLAHAALRARSSR